MGSTLESLLIAFVLDGCQLDCPTVLGRGDLLSLLVCPEPQQLSEPVLDPPELFIFPPENDRLVVGSKGQADE